MAESLNICWDSDAYRGGPLIAYTNLYEQRFNRVGQDRNSSDAASSCSPLSKAAHSKGVSEAMGSTQTPIGPNLRVQRVPSTGMGSRQRALRVLRYPYSHCPSSPPGRPRPEIGNYTQQRRASLFQLPCRQTSEVAQESE